MASSEEGGCSWITFVRFSKAVRLFSSVVCSPLSMRACSSACFCFSVSTRAISAFSNRSFIFLSWLSMFSLCFICRSIFSRRALL
uniref:Uncharacterized protein n=1 Tax=Streptococcus suis TaxID=1307 RepID=A0A2H4I700_STRSU|nr:hypothetical protein [Streptococcus suis]